MNPSAFSQTALSRWKVSHRCFQQISKVHPCTGRMTPYKVRILQSCKNERKQETWDLPLFKGKHCNLTADTYSECPDVFTVQGIIFKTPQK